MKVPAFVIFTISYGLEGKSQVMKAKFIPLSGYHEYSPAAMEERSAGFYADVRRRRTVRDFSDRPVPREIIENCLLAAGTAPNGANMQPWHFVVVSNPDLKREIRAAAEAEEREFYNKKAPQEWLDALEPLGTDEHKPFLETAPYLCPELWAVARRPEGEELLRSGIGGYRHRHSHHRLAP